MIGDLNLRYALSNHNSLSAAALGDLYIDALGRGLWEEVAASAALAVASVHRDEPRIWQMLGLARRSLLDSSGAMHAFEQAAALAPNDVLIAHSVARVAEEAGWPALSTYERALKMAPASGEIINGYVSALARETGAQAALDYLESVLCQHPGWYAGHVAYARIAAFAGISAVAKTIRSALADFPGDSELWRTLIQIDIGRRDYTSLVQDARGALQSLGDASEWRRFEAIGLSEGGEVERAQRLFDHQRLPRSAGEAVAPIRNLIRLGRFEQAMALDDRITDTSDSALWPYRALLWRVAGDSRWQWLEGDPNLIGIYDLATSIGDISRVAEILRGLHAVSGRMLDQSVCGGTQTDGHLFARAEPELSRLRDIIADAVSHYVKGLPPPRAGHPTLLERRSPLRFAGAWSVRLMASGHHVDHVHPDGWISSALYIALPQVIGDGGHGDEGWLTFGECRDLMPELDGFRKVQPIVGRLVLFPSTMWHGTRPFSDGERLTVAFDIARP